MKQISQLVLAAVFCMPPALAAQAPKDDPPVKLLPHMKDLPVEYQDRLRRCLVDQDARLEKLKEGQQQPVTFTGVAICSFALGRNVDRLNKYFASDAFDLKNKKEK